MDIKLLDAYRVRMPKQMGVLSGWSTHMD